MFRLSPLLDPTTNFDDCMTGDDCENLMANDWNDEEVRIYTVTCQG